MFHSPHIDVFYIEFIFILSIYSIFCRIRTTILSYQKLTSILNLVNTNFFCFLFFLFVLFFLLSNIKFFSIISVNRIFKYLQNKIQQKKTPPIQAVFRLELTSFSRLLCIYPLKDFPSEASLASNGAGFHASA